MVNDPLYDLLLPGLISVEAKLIGDDHPQKGKISKKADAHLREWVGQHRDDYKAKFYPDMIAWYKANA